MWSTLKNRKTQYAIAALTVCLVLFLQGSRIHNGSLNGAHVGWKGAYDTRDDIENRTLGFQNILAVSAAPSWRTHGLQAAARLTGLDIEVPRQPKNSPEFIDAFREMRSKIEGAKELKRGSAIAWLAHLDMLKFVISSKLSTALIIEDDVDWDVDLKSQMQRLSDNVHKFLEIKAARGWPYGRDWDVLWIGHCGERSDVDVPYVQYEDSHRILPEHYTGWSGPSWIPVIPLGHRRVQKAVQPVCSFGYAVTYHSAQQILILLGAGGDEAYDVSLQRMCTSKRLRCIVVTPQLMVHQELPEELGYQSDVHVGDGIGTAGDPSLLDDAKGFTANIEQSARCKALWDSKCLPKSVAG